MNLRLHVPVISSRKRNTEEDLKSGGKSRATAMAFSTVWNSCVPLTIITVAYLVRTGKAGTTECSSAKWMRRILNLWDVWVPFYNLCAFFVQVFWVDDGQKLAQTFTLSFTSRVIINIYCQLKENLCNTFGLHLSSDTSHCVDIWALSSTKKSETLSVTSCSRRIVSGVRIF